MATVITVTHDDGHRTARTVTAEELDTLTGTELAHRVLSHPTAADISAFETVINEFQGKRGVSPTEVEVTAAAVMARSRNLEDVSDDDVTDAELAEQELTADQERRLARQLIDDGLLPPSAAETPGGSARPVRDGAGDRDWSGSEATIQYGYWNGHATDGELINKSLNGDSLGKWEGKTKRLLWGYGREIGDLAQALLDCGEINGDHARQILRGSR